MPAKKFDESREEMEGILREETVGYLGLSMDGMPYVVPLNYGYVEGRILFHCALMGKKLDYLRANPQVCFTVERQAGRVVRHPQGARCHVENDSVICYGSARVVEDVEERREVLTTFNRCLQPDTEEITLEAASKCYAVEIKITEMTGRRQRGLKHTYWRYSFEGQVQASSQLVKYRMKACGSN
jgi:nitroimidazol reductase NimA-like FMN-containing flavoprotein (pyridoxamine 5'-phosphate oxidase superfamily)